MAPNANKPLKLRFSRWMAPIEGGSWWALALLSPFIFVLSPIILIGWVDLKRHFRRLASNRKGEDIGSFARSFDRHHEPFDPWVIRATWDALRPTIYLPLRPSDSLNEDLRIDPDDIDDLLEEVTRRSRHSLASPESNPFYGKVITVGDFVRFVTARPKLHPER